MTDKQEVVWKIHESGVIGILRVESVEVCMKTIEALIAGGVTALEVTTTTPDSATAVAKASGEFGEEAIVGIGTVLDGATAEKGIRAGAQFVVSPSLSKEVIDVCKEHGVVACPGTFTATEIVQAWNWGADLIKVFPASSVGPGYIKSILAPLPWVKLVPTGGIDAGNAADYIKAGAFCVGVGGALTSPKAIAAGRYDQLTAAAKELVAAVKSTKVR